MDADKIYISDSLYEQLGNSTTLTLRRTRYSYKNVTINADEIYKTDYKKLDKVPKYFNFIVLPFDYIKEFDYENIPNDELDTYTVTYGIKKNMNIPDGYSVSVGSYVFFYYDYQKYLALFSVITILSFALCAYLEAYIDFISLKEMNDYLKLKSLGVSYNQYKKVFLIKQLAKLLISASVSFFVIKYFKDINEMCVNAEYNESSGLYKIFNYDMVKFNYYLLFIPIVVNITLYIYYSLKFRKYR